MDDDSSDMSSEGEGCPLAPLLHIYAETGQANMIKELIDNYQDHDLNPSIFRQQVVDVMDSNGSTALHVAIIHGHASCVSELLRGGASASKPCDGSPPLALAACLALSGARERQLAAGECTRALLARGADPHSRDDGGRTALHWASAAGNTELVSALLEAATTRQRARVRAMVSDAISAAAAAAAAAVGDGGAPIEGGAQASLRPGGPPEHILAVADADGLTPLHLAAKFGHAAAVSQLLAAAAESGPAAATAATELAEFAAGQAATGPAAAAPPPAAAPIDEGDTTAAAAAGLPNGAAAGAPAVVPPGRSAILAQLPVTDATKLLQANKARNSQTPLHLAALYGRAEAAEALLQGAAAAAQQAAAADKKGRTAAQLARRRGHTALAAALESAAGGGPFELPTEAAGAATAAAAAARTLLLAPEECLLHRTAPEPLSRGDSEPPPENVHRLHVLTRPGSGILHNDEFAALEWRTSGIPQAAMVDVLKCHEWSYVRGVIQACDAIQDDPSAVGSLDADTAISRHSMKAALVAAGAVCRAVDEVVSGKARNAFCAVRPPGHHAGPTGIVANPNESHGSHGFCLLSNVAIGAAYAVSMHRNAGIGRVAILDFDVHHGNGTQACVLNTAPTVRTIPVRTPYSEGVQRFPVYKPWLGDGDLHNIFFASVQGYGRRNPPVGWFYPGSGSTADSAIAETLRPAGTPAADADTPPAAAASPPQPGPSIAAADGGTGTSCPPASPSSSPSSLPLIPEDPDGEFRGGYDVTVVGGPRVINVGIPGPGSKPRMWRRAWRDKILPALANFRPDIIFVSAGFDAHKKEDLNLRYVGVTEADYEWLTEQIVEVANSCCGGRVVSVLEGGYNLRGGPLGSAFARSVAAHVRSLAAATTAAYDPADAASERAAEKAVEAKKAAKAAALVAGIHAAAAAAASKPAAPTSRGVPPMTPAAAAAAAGVAAAAAAAAADTAVAAAAAEGLAPMDTGARPSATPAEGAAGGDDAGPPSKRRRRPAVDYAALNAELERESTQATVAATAAVSAAAAAAGEGPAGGGDTMDQGQ